MYIMLAHIYKLNEQEDVRLGGSGVSSSGARTIGGGTGGGTGWVDAGATGVVRAGTTGLTGGEFDNCLDIWSLVLGGVVEPPPT
jgi:hypothetical protein